jgi:DNA repair exonuclease SbcCD ATPase subunit
LIERITIVGFQKHAKRTIILSAGVTTVCGSNGAGKSSVLRALKWAMLNRPNGSSYIKWGAESASVSVVIDGVKVRRFRDRVNNCYVVGTERYDAVANGVPDAVQAVLNVGDVNFQSQHSASFWFSDSPGQVAAALNRIVNLQSIDATLAHLNNASKRLKVAVELAESARDDATKQADALAWVEQADAEYRFIEQRQEDIDAKASRIASLASLIEHATELSARADDASRAKADALKLIRRIDAHAALSERVESLCRLTESLRTHEANVERYRRERGRLEKSLQEAESKRCPTCGNLAS